MAKESSGLMTLRPTRAMGKMLRTMASPRDTFRSAAISLCRCRRVPGTRLHRHSEIAADRKVSLGLAIVRSIFPIARVGRNVIRPDDSFAIKRRRKHGGIARHGKLRERFARHARKRVEHVRLALLVNDVIEESPKLRPGSLGGGVGHGLHNAFEIEFTGNDGTRLEKSLEQCLLFMQLLFGFTNLVRLRAIANDRNSANDLSCAVAEWTVFTFEVTGPAGFSNPVLTIFTTYVFPGECVIKEAVLADLG